MSFWNNTGSGNWSSAGNWSAGVPDAIGATSAFVNLAGTPQTHAINLSGSSFTVGALYMASSFNEHYSIGSGTLTLYGLSTNALINVFGSGPGAPTASVLADGLTLNLVTTTEIRVDSNSTLDVQAQITGGGTIIKTGAGTLRVSDISIGDVIGARMLTVVSEGVLETSIGTGFGLTGGLVLGGSSKLVGTADLTFSDAIEMSSGSSPTICAEAGKTMTIGGFFSAQGGAGTVLHFGDAVNTGTVVFNNFNGSYSQAGSISIDGGTLRAVSFLFSSLALNMSGLNVAAGATLDISGSGLPVNHLTGGGLVTRSAASAGLLSLYEEANAAFSGKISDGAGIISVSKHLAGTLALSGINSYSGNTLIELGTLSLSGIGSIAASSKVSVSDGGTLDITGITVASTSIIDLENSGTVKLGGHALYVTQQSANLSGIFEGSASADVLSVNLNSTVSNFSLESAIFNGWTDSADAIAVFGNILANSITGSSHADSVFGGAGADNLSGGGGNDALIGGVGDDIIAGGADNDTLFMDDYTRTASTNGADVGSGDGGDDLLWGFGGNDRLFGGDGNDTLVGNDFFAGETGIDALYGDAGNDRLYLAYGGIAYLNGGEGNDTLYGWTGTDTLRGGTGSDYLYGDGGADFLQFYREDMAAGDKDIVYFVNGGDHLQFSASLNGSLYFQDLAALKYDPSNAALTTTGVYITVFLGGGVTSIITVYGTTVAALTSFVEFTL